MMKILLNSNSVALYFDGFVVKSDCIEIGPGANWDYNSSNTTVIDVEPPTPALSNVWKWENGAWTCIDQATIDAHLTQQVTLFNAAQKQHRAATYSSEADPLFFKAQRGEATMEEWKAKVEQIKTRYPYQS